MNNDRRNFLKQSCGFCASLIGISLVMPAIQGCSPLITLKTNVSKGTIGVSRASFTEENKLVIVKNEAQEFDIAVVHLGGDSFKAFELQCTHQSNPVIPTKNGFFCNAHGSSFSFEGKVNKPPAQRNLKEYTLEITQNQITITV